MLPNPEDEAGGLPIWTIAVLIVFVLSVMMFRPRDIQHTTLEDGLGPVVATQSLPI
ncbi:MAG: hypothetical protein GKR98_09790 [Boseongicola sp.]|nr:MAG: hypothetical protein GKR98_09790 [Boseongicola sp.]